MSNQEKDSQRLIFRRLFSYVKTYKTAFYISLVAMVGYGAIDALFLYLVQPFIDEGLMGKNQDVFIYAPIFVIVLFMFRGACNFAATYGLSWVGSNVVMTLRQQLFEHMLRLPVSYHDQQSTGDLISKITYDTEQVSNACSKALLIMVREGALVLFLLISMFIQSWQLSLVFLIIGPVIGVVASYVSKRFRKVSKSIQSSMGEVTTTSEQMLNGHKVVLMFGGQEKEQQRFAKSNNNNRRQLMKMVATKATAVPVIQIIASFALAAVLYIASFPSILDSLSPGSFTSIVTSMVVLLRPLKQLTNVNADFQRGMAASASVFELLDREAEQDTGKLEKDRVKGEINVENVTFSYVKDQRPALDNVSFSIPQGKTLALVGRSGSGKSTISNLLTRFYSIDEGTISIDGESVEDYTLASLRKQFALVSQHVTLFNDTIANNIAYGSDDATQEQIIEAARVAHVMEFIDKLPEGLNTEIGENGVMLSGGQRQRIAIARAILRDAPILILDEATSALDTESERAIQDALNKLQQGRTCIVIAHRLSTIENADEILVVDSGKVVEQGTHKELLGKQGIYSQLHNMQFGDQ